MEIRQLLQMNADQFLEYEISDYVMPEITYSSVLCSLDQSLMLSAFPHSIIRDAVFPIEHILGKLSVPLPRPPTLMSCRPF